MFSLAIALTWLLILAEINMVPMSHVSMSEHKKKIHPLEPREEEAHLHFRARFSNLCRPLLICPSPPRPSAINANKPKLQESKDTALEFINSLKET